MKILITGGAGFIGINAASRFLEENNKVIIFDDLLRKGAAANVKWLRSHGKFEFIKGDIRNYKQVKSCFLRHKDIGAVLHLAAQVAVTDSILNPRKDFETNALGTFNICEGARQVQPEAVILNASTNKVYGSLNDLEIIEENGIYKYKALPYGISETRFLDFCSPYGCSKGSADQYVRDYTKTYALKSVTFRQSCIYGSRQFGTEDQGWVAWFTICAVLGNPITIYGDGKQTRDVLFIGDLLDCYLSALNRINEISGETYNIGGGPENVLSPLRLVSILEQISGIKIKYSLSDWRLGDQKVFICDIRKALKDFKWKPKIKTEEGIKRLFEWISENKKLLSTIKK